MEYKPFTEIVSVLKNGKRCRRKDWPREDFIFHSGSNVYDSKEIFSAYSSHHVSDHFKGKAVYQNNRLCYVRDEVIVESYRLSADDIFLNDWIILD